MYLSVYAALLSAYLFEYAVFFSSYLSVYSAFDGLGERLSENDSEGLNEGDVLGEKLLLNDPDKDIEVLSVTLCDKDAESDVLRDSLKLGEKLVLVDGLTLALMLALGVSENDNEGESEILTDSDPDGLSERESDGLREGL